MNCSLLVPFVVVLVAAAAAAASESASSSSLVTPIPPPPAKDDDPALLIPQRWGRFVQGTKTRRRTHNHSHRPGTTNHHQQTTAPRRRRQRPRPPTSTQLISPRQGVEESQQPPPPQHAASDSTGDFELTSVSPIQSSLGGLTGLQGLPPLSLIQFVKLLVAVTPFIIPIIFVPLLLFTVGMFMIPVNKANNFFFDNDDSPRRGTPTSDYSWTPNLANAHTDKYLQLLSNTTANYFLPHDHDLSSDTFFNRYNVARLIRAGGQLLVQMMVSSPNNNDTPGAAAADRTSRAVQQLDEPTAAACPLNKCTPTPTAFFHRLLLLLLPTT